MKREIWKSVLDYISLYEVSNYGRVRSLKFGKVRILKVQKDKKGYLRVQLCKNGNKKWFLIHRLVYEAFNSVIPEGIQVNHINEIITDNRLSNLNLMSCKENINYGTGNQRRAKKLSDPVLQLTLDDELIREWSSAAEAGRNGFSQGCISECCNGKRKSHKGFKWMKKSPLS